VQLGAVDPIIALHDFLILHASFPPYISIIPQTLSKQKTTQKKRSFSI